MKKYRLILKNGVYRIQTKNKTIFFGQRWKNVDYAYNIEAAKKEYDKYASGENDKVIAETGWFGGKTNKKEEGMSNWKNKFFLFLGIFAISFSVAFFALGIFLVFNTTKRTSESELVDVYRSGTYRCTIRV